MLRQAATSAALLLLAGLIWRAGWLVEPARGFPIAIVLSAPVIALALMPLLTCLAGASLRSVRQMAYRDIEGRHYEYKGRSIRVHEDLTGERWLRTRDIRKILPRLPQDRVLLRLAPQALGRAERSTEVFFHADALDGYLERNQDDSAIRFRNWLQREVILPARRATELGLARTAVRHDQPGA